MAKILFNITNGTGNPTKASLGFMLARTAVEEGHEVSAISCEIRGVTDQDLKDTNSRKVLPKTLLNLSLEADRTFVY